MNAENPFNSICPKCKSKLISMNKETSTTFSPRYVCNECSCELKTKISPLVILLLPLAIILPWLLLEILIPWLHETYGLTGVYRAMLTGGLASGSFALLMKLALNCFSYKIIS